MNWLERKYWHHRLAGSPYQTLFESQNSSKLVSLDCETTSLNPKRAELVSIAFTAIVDNQVRTSDSSEIKLKAPHSLCEESVRIHQIRHQDLKQGIDEKTAIEQLINAIGNATLVGYHIRYDKKILDIACRKHLGFPLPNPVIEVSQLYQKRLEKLLPNAYYDLSLDAICRHLGIPLHHRHDALSDAITAALIYVQLTHGSMPPLPAPKSA